MGTFLNPPRIYDAVQRLRLFKLFDNHAYKQNILVVGQAAQGKSTLVASYLEKREEPVLWFQLSAQDNNPIKLFETLTHGLSCVLNTSDPKKNMTAGLRSTLGTSKDGLRHVEALSTIFKELPFAVTVVIDDLQTLDEASTGFLLIKHLVDLELEKVKLILLSRNLPCFDLARLKMNRQLFIIDNERLAFTLDETRLYFKKMQIDHPVDVKKIHQATEGWAGGITIVSESIRQFKDMPRLPERFSADVFDFFSQEIYTRLDKSIQKFLMKTSILETIDLEAVNHILSTRNGLNILRDIEKRNLFIQRIGSDTNSPKFKFHDLFRNFLLKNLSSAEGEDGIKKLNKKAGEFFWDKKDHAQAVNYFIHARSFSDIIRVIKIKGTDYIIKGKLSEPERWISYLPESTILNDPWLLFFQTMTQRIKGGKKNISRLERALVFFEKENENRGILLSLGFLIEAGVFIRLPSSKIIEWIYKGEHILKKMGTSHRYPWARGLLWQLVGLGYIAGDGNIPKGVSACRNAILLGQQIQNHELIINASITMTFGYVQAGDFIRARKMLTKIEHMTHTGRHPEYRSLRDIVDIELALKNGQFDMARILLTRSEADIEKFGLIFLYPGYVEVKAYHLVYTSRFDEARQMADHLNDFSILEGNDFYSGISHRIKALTDLCEKKYGNALTQIHLAVDQLNKAKKGDIHHFLAKQLEGVILYSNKQFKEAEKSLLPSLDYFLKISSDLSVVETDITMGLVSWAQGKEKKGLNYIQEGFEKASRKNYIFFPLLNNQMLSQAILISAANNSKNSFDDHVRGLISRCDKQMVFYQMNQMMAGMKKKEKSNTKENFRLLYKKLLPKLKILSLGQFSVQNVAEHTGPMQFEGSRPVLLLKSIVLHGARDIPKEILIDDLWPDADAASGEKNFKINLHRLRKAIEPEYEKEFGYSYIIQKSGLISLDRELVSLDVDEFMDLSKQALKSENDGLLEKAQDQYDKALRIYNGEYFAEEPYMEWLNRKRDLYRSRHMEILQKKAMLHEELGQSELAIETWRIMLQIDPCFEKAYQNLMILYADCGQKSMAMDLFEDCKVYLARELGTGPDTQTTRIHKKIRYS